MDYELYNKNFLQLQRDYMNLNDLIAKIKETQLQKYVAEEGATSQYEKYKKEYLKLNSKIYATAVSLKDYFVANNEEFNETNFKFSLSFFNGYSIMENTPLLLRSDYQKLNSEFLESYKTDLEKVLLVKKEQYETLDKIAKTDEEEYKKEFVYGKNKNNTENINTRAVALSAKYKKDVYQREAVNKKVHFIEKEIYTIESVLEQYNLKDL